MLGSTDRDMDYVDFIFGLIVHKPIKWLGF